MADKVSFKEACRLSSLSYLPSIKMGKLACTAEDSFSVAMLYHKQSKLLHILSTWQLWPNGLHSFQQVKIA